MLLVIGFLLGLIAMLLFIWITYFTRSFMFTYCPTTLRGCGGDNFYNDPGDALVNNPQLSPKDILYINDNSQMFYKRIPKTTDCIVESNQLVYMKYPQYCSFSSEGIWKETAFNSNIYKPINFVGPTITTEGNCIPVTGSSVDNGIPLLKWDSNAIS